MKRKVLIITDGDAAAQKAVEKIAQKVGGRCISMSGGNPTPLSGREIVQLIKDTPYDPVLVMVDDRGKSSRGRGEEALKSIAEHPDVEVLGVVAVASNTQKAKGTLVDFSVTKNNEIIDAPVDKYGNAAEFSEYLKGDTVDVLRSLDIPIVVGVGDIGKQDGADYNQAPVTTEAVSEILRRSGYLNGNNEGKSSGK